MSQYKTGLPADRKRAAAGIQAARAIVFALLAVSSPYASSDVDDAALHSEYRRHAADGNEQAQLHCLALNVYHEARGEPIEGKFAVAAVTINRVASRRFPHTVCRVVWQRSQFSWTNDGRPDAPYEADAWEEALHVATVVYRRNRSSAAVGRATFFHTVGVRPSWARKKRRVGQVGQHIFYESSGS